MGQRYFDHLDGRGRVLKRQNFADIIYEIPPCLHNVLLLVFHLLFKTSVKSKLKTKNFPIVNLFHLLLVLTLV